MNLGSRWSLTRRLFGWWLTAMLSGRWARFQIAMLLSSAQAEFEETVHGKLARERAKKEATPR